MKQKYMSFWNSLAFSIILRTLAIWFLVPLPLWNPPCTSGSSAHILLKPSSKDSEYNLTCMWNEHNCTVVWTFFGIVLLWDWKENWPFLIPWPLLSFPNLLAYWVQHFHSIIFWIWNSSAWILSLPLALFVVMLPKAHLTLHSRMSCSLWVITPLWLSGHLYLFV